MSSEDEQLPTAGNIGQPPATVDVPASLQTHLATIPEGKKGELYT